MRVKKNVILAIWLCFLPLACLSANVQSVIQPAAEALDYKFFHKLVEKDMLGEAYAQAQVEDFEPGEKALFTDKMLGYFRYPKNFWDMKVKGLDGLWQLESQLETLDGQAGTELLQEWRYTFLSKMMTFMQEKASRKALFKLTLTSKTEYNSNVNRVNDDQSVTINSPTDPDGKDDWQQLLTMNLKWFPLINHKGFSKNNKFEQTFNMINIHQMAHKSNEVLIFDTESKYTRMLKNDLLDDFSLAYRAQNFGLSGNASSRHTHAKSYSHRLKAGWNFKAIKLGEGTFKETQTMLSLGYLNKKQLDQRSISKNADDWTFDWVQDFDYILGSHDGSLKATLGYRHYDTKSDVSGDYDYFIIKLTHKADYNVIFLSKPLKFSQELSYRSKDWETSVAKTPREEEFTYAQIKAETKICKATKVSLSAKQAWRDREIIVDGKKKANQTIVALGLNWSTP